ncbi:hypothetical protein EVAR_30504_1 [Eumeta japonica]|uniref:Uncharacterized protein n=1 Tax=Eumeta variegata TaxID=151549 RepID=A0A4C1VYJ3_EUMVA|nr:hypothetical protein EVAR_30504_1 [Eumeta japonica]
MEAICKKLMRDELVILIIKRAPALALPMVACASPRRARTRGVSASSSLSVTSPSTVQRPDGGRIAPEMTNEVQSHSEREAQACAHSFIVRSALDRYSFTGPRKDGEADYEDIGSAKPRRGRVRSPNTARPAAPHA